MPPVGGGAPPTPPPPQPPVTGLAPEDIVDIAAALERVLEVTDALVQAVRGLVEVHLALKQQLIDANRAALTYYAALQNIYTTMPSFVSAYGELGNAVTATTQAFSNLAAATTDVGRAFYDFIGTAIQTGNAATLISGSITVVSGALQGVARTISTVQEGINAFVNLFGQAVNAVTQPINAMLQLVERLSSSMSNFYDLVATSLTRGFGALSDMFDSWGGSMRNLINVLGESQQMLGFLGEVIGAVTGRFEGFIKSIVQLYNLRFQTFIADLNIIFTDLLRQLQPVITELVRMQQLLAIVGQVFQFVSQVVNTLTQVVGQLLGVFGTFVNTWLQGAQALAQVQETLNIIGLNLRDVNNTLAQSAQQISVYNNALNALTDALTRANLSMSALAETIQTFHQAGIIATTAGIERFSDTVNTLATRLGVLPDTVARGLAALATGGEGLRQFLPTLTAGAVDIAIMQRMGMLGLPIALRAPFAVEFAAQAVRQLIPEGGAPATLVQFAQALRTLGQMLQAQFAQAEPFGGRQILEDIRNILREFVTGEIGQNLRSFFRWVSTGLAEGLRAFLAGFREIIRMPQFVEFGRGIGEILRAIGTAFGDALRSFFMQYRPEDIRNFFLNFAASVYGFIRAGLNFIVGLVRELITYFTAIFQGGGGIFQFLGAIINMFSAALGLGVDMLNLAQRIGNLIASWFQTTADSMASLARTASLIQAGLQVIVGVLIALAGVALGWTVIGGAAAIGLGAGIAVTGVIEFVRALRRTPENLMREYGLEQAISEIRNFQASAADAAAQARNLGLNMESISAATRQFGTNITNLTRAAIGEYQFYRQQFLTNAQAMELFRNSVSGASEALNTMRERIYQYIQPFFKGLEDAAEVAGEFSRTLRPILPGVFYTPVAPGGVLPIMRVGGMDVLFGGRAPAIAALMEMIPRQMQAAAIAQTLEILRTMPPELLAGVPAGEIERLWRDLTQHIQRDVQGMARAIADELDALDTRLQYFEVSARMRIALGADPLATAMERLAGSVNAAAASMVNLGAASVALEQLRAAYPGIERTVEFQKLQNQLIQAQVELMNRLGQQWVRLAEVTRRYYQVAAEGAAEMLAWGYRLEDVYEGLAELLRGDAVRGARTLIEAGMGALRPGWENLIAATRASWSALLTDIQAETRRAFGQLLAGNVEQFYEGMRQVQQRVLQLPEEYINRIRNAFNTAMRPLNYFNDLINEARSSLSSIGAEMALFPYILTRSIPALIDMRNQFAAAAQEAYRLGDILSFNEALRNVAQLQRQIMELLGVTGAFMPAYTPEQMLRMFMRIGMPTQAEVIEAARGRMMIEPAVFRAVPIPIAQFFGLPAPAGMRLTPDIFGGYPLIFAGMQALTPDMVRAEFRRLQLEGLRMLYGGAMDVATVRAGLAGAYELGRQMAFDVLQALRAGYGAAEQQLLTQLLTRYGAAVPPQLLRSFLPPMPAARPTISPLEALSPVAMLQRAALEPQAGDTITREWRAISTQLDNAVTRLADAARSIADIFANLNLRLQTQPINIEIPLTISVVDERTGERVQKMERSLYIRLNSRQPT